MRDREERRQLTEEQETELRSERARAASTDHQRSRVAQRFGWSGTTRKTRLVPCRDCGTPTELSEFADLIVEASRGYLEKLGEPPLTDGELTRCDECGQFWKERQARLAIAERDTMLKILRKPLRPTEFEYGWLESHGYRDTAMALRERWSNRHTKKPNPGQRKLALVEEPAE